jgi:hypothetical protein
VDFPSAPGDYLAAASANSVKRLFDSAIVHAQDRLDWYDKKANQLSRSAKTLRLLSILCFAIGTAMPVLMALVIKWPTGAPPTPATTAAAAIEFRTWPLTEAGYVLLALAGALVIFDQFFDLSGSWIRYRQAQARLEVQVADLRYQWASLLAECGGVMPEGANAAKFVNLLRDFIVRVELTAETETTEWATQFRSRIQAFDRNPDLKVRLPGEEAPKPPPGAKPDDAAKVADGKAPPATPVADQHTVKVRLAVADTETTQQLTVNLNDHPIAIPADGNVEVPLEVDRPHTFVARGMRNGAQVSGTLQITPTRDDEGKPLLLTLL